MLLLLFIPFDRVHERDRRTDRQTDIQTPYDGIGRACIASRGKKDMAIITTANLNVSRQCAEAVLKVNKVSGTVDEQCKGLSKQGFLVVYKGYVMPHLKYHVIQAMVATYERR